MKIRKTYITEMPDEIGAFLKATEIISSIGANITRVSYNKAVDMHLLFIEVIGYQGQHEEINNQLTKIGYLESTSTADSSIVLIDFVLQDIPGALLPVLQLINKYAFNISYINSQENNSKIQHFKMGIFAENSVSLAAFIEEVGHLCEVNIINYDKANKVIDNTSFYKAFATQISTKLGLTEADKKSLIADSNRIMQLLDARNESPYKTFSYIGKFADMISSFKGSNFKPLVSTKQLKNNVKLTLIEPPCGSNIYVYSKENSLFFIDSGFACFKTEMETLLNTLFPNFSTAEKSIIITHPDIDHCGLLSLFDTVYVSPKAYENFVLEKKGIANFREQNMLNAPYCRISKILSNYKPQEISSLKILSFESNLFQNFIIYEGNDGHATGEIVIVDIENRLVFSGDIVVNIKGFSKEQLEFNTLAPYLMTGVDMDSSKAKKERAELFEKFPRSEYVYCGGHGCFLEKILNTV